jgi:hypothetical protein
VSLLGCLTRLLILPAIAGGCLFLGACACDDTDTWGSTYIVSAEAETGPDEMAPPVCDVETAAVAESPGTRVDPNLVEIARLEVERDCYKGAEAELRQRLEGAPASLK